MIHLCPSCSVVACNGDVSHLTERGEARVLSGLAKLGELSLAGDPKWDCRTCDCCKRHGEGHFATFEVVS